MERYFRRNKWVVKGNDGALTKSQGRKRVVDDESGQGSVEFALILFAFLGIVIAFGALWNVLEEGLFVEHALGSASHHLQAVFPGAVGDILLF